MCVYQEIVKWIPLHVNTKYLVLYICATILIEKRFHSIAVTWFLIFDKKTLILYSFLTTKTIQI